MSLIVGAILGALVSSVSGYVLRMLEAVTNDKAAAVSEHIDEVRQIRDYAVEYWLNDPTADPEKEKHLAVLVRGSLFASASFEEHAATILRKNRTKYSDLFFKLENAATGGDFQSAQRTSSPERATEVIKASSELISFLYTRRRSVFFAH